MTTSMWGRIPVTDWLVIMLIAGGLAGVFLGALRLRVPGWGMLILALLPVLLIYLVNPHYRIYSRHGLMHVSIVNQVLVHGVPPEAPCRSSSTATTCCNRSPTPR